jgi:hypothetical protein
LLIDGHGGRFFVLFAPVNGLRLPIVFKGIVLIVDDMQEEVSIPKQELHFIWVDLLDFACNLLDYLVVARYL